jgi:hypothetical protein
MAIQYHLLPSGKITKQRALIEELSVGQSAGTAN